MVLNKYLIRGHVQLKYISRVDPAEGLGDFNQRMLKSSSTSEVAARSIDRAGDVLEGGKRISREVHLKWVGRGKYNLLVIMSDDHRQSNGLTSVMSISSVTVAT